MATFLFQNWFLFWRFIYESCTKCVFLFYCPSW